MGLLPGSQELDSGGLQKGSLLKAGMTPPDLHIPWGLQEHSTLLASPLVPELRHFFFSVLGF
jgi:hypothetical protein